MSQSNLKILKRVVNDPYLRKDYDMAKNRDVKAAAARVRNAMTKIQEAANRIREDMLEILYDEPSS